ncbi:NAD(P)-dependent alcohol dehydrogenase [Gordonia terrae]|uniref:NAD(P)-dependent alcohol dehydrogenase n=1 Tax=Gordonia terrae TaxID=2055 RepID=UPI003F6AF82B
MKAAVLTEYRRDFEITEVQDPTITAPDEAIVRVGAAGLCRTDLHLWDGQFDEAHKAADLSLPFVCGHETAGWVEEIGPGVRHLAVGDAVLLHPLATCGYCKACRAGDDMHCTASMFPGVFAPGGFAEYVKTNARALVPLPDNLTPAQVAPLGCAGLTAYRAVRKSLPLAVPGTHTVVLGAGGLGHIGIQALRALSQTEIIVVDRSETALEHARGWGADHRVLAKDDRSHVSEIRELTGGAGAAVVIDFVGEGGAERDGVELLGPNGVDMLVGYGGKLEVEILGEALFPETSFVGNICGNYNELVELVALTARGTIDLTTTLFPLDGVNDALHALDEGRLIGRGLLTPNEK